MLSHPAIYWSINTDLWAANWYGTKMCPSNQFAFITKAQQHVIDPANSRCALDDSVENWLHVRRRPANDAEHLGCRRLMLQCFAQFRVALLDFFEQAHIL